MRTKQRLAMGLLLLVGILVLNSWGMGAEVHPLSAETLWKLKRIGDPSLSPEGKWAVVSVTTYDLKKDEGDGDLWLIPTGVGEARQLTTHAGEEGEPIWSPDNRYIAFTAQRGEEVEAQLYVIPVDGGEARKVANIPTGVEGIQWFPDSRHIAFITRVWPDADSWQEQEKRLKDREQSLISAKVYDSARLKFWDHWIDERQAHVYMVNIENGNIRPITLACSRELPYKTFDADSYDISPDGKELAFVSDTAHRPGVEENLDIYVVKIGDSSALNITADNPERDSAPVFSPDSRYIAFRRQKVKGFYGDRSRLVVHDRRTGQNRVLTEHFDYSCRAAVWTPDSGRIYFISDRQGLDRIVYVNLKGGDPVVITDQKSFGSLRMGTGGKFLVGLRQGFSEPPTLVKIVLPRGTQTQLSRFNDEVLKHVQWGEIKNVTYTGAGGDTIQMWLILPPGYKAGQKRPLYLLIHGGPHNAVNDSFHFRWNAQVFAGWGYVCAWPNFHGSSGFGNDFTASILGNWADLPYEDVIKASGWLVDKGYVDPQQMSAGGGSYGGYLASLILGRNHPYKALIVHAGVTNLYEMYASDFGSSEPNEQAPHFWEDMAFFKKCSPHYFAANFKTPTLVIHGEKDYRVPIGNGLELFGVLQAKGVPSRLIYFPDENHWVLKPNNSIFWYNEVRHWLDRWTRKK